MFSWQFLKVLAFVISLIVPVPSAIGAESDAEWLWSKRSRGIWEDPLETVPKVDMRRNKTALPVQLYPPRVAQLIEQVREQFSEGGSITPEEVEESPVSNAVVTTRNGLRGRPQPVAVLASNYGQVAYRTGVIPGLIELVVEPTELENGRALTYKRRVDFRLWTISFGSDPRYDGRLKFRFSGSRGEAYLYFEKPF